MTIFLQIIGKKDSNRDVQEIFQHFRATRAIISLVFYKVLAAILILYQKVVIIPNNFELLDSRIVNNTKYFPYFENCLGLLDGTYLLAHLSITITPLYQN